MLVVRPIAVFVATIRSDFSIRERIFLSLLAPRGVVIAALSLSFVLEIIFNNPLGLGELATLLLWYLIIIVFVSILIEGGLASWIAKKTGVIEPEMKEPET